MEFILFLKKYREQIFHFLLARMAIVNKVVYISSKYLYISVSTKMVLNKIVLLLLIIPAIAVLHQTNVEDVKIQAKLSVFQSNCFVNFKGEVTGASELNEMGMNVIKDVAVGTFIHCVGSVFGNNSIEAETMQIIRDVSEKITNIGIIEETTVSPNSTEIQAKINGTRNELSKSNDNISSSEDFSTGAFIFYGVCALVLVGFFVGTVIMIYLRFQQQSDKTIFPSTKIDAEVQTATFRSETLV